MNKSKIAIMAFVLVLLLTITACSGNSGGNREVIREPDKTITIIDNESKKPEEELVIVVGDIKKYEKMDIFGWLDEETVIVSMENEALGKMKLEELADSYPLSLYQYNLKTGQVIPLKEQENTYLGGINLSPDKEHLVYQAYSIGDPSYFLMNLETLQTVRIPLAMSARWVDNDSVIGASYAGGAYTATTGGDIDALTELGDEFLFLVVQIGSKLYFNTNAHESLKVMDMKTKEISDLGFDAVSNIIPSPDGTQLLVEHYEGSKAKLILSELDGTNARTIVDGAELSGISWSSDQRLIAYSKQDEVSGVMVKGLYVHDLLSGEATRISANIDSAVSTSWSPSGKALSYSVWNGSSYESSVIEIQAFLATGVD